MQKIVTKAHWLQLLKRKLCIVVTVSLITPQWKGFEDRESHHCKQQTE